MKRRKDNHLAEGEVTGHSHQATAEDAEVYGDGDERELHCPSGTTVTHEEHAHGILPPGVYEISKQREIDPDTEEIRNVAD